MSYSTWAQDQLDMNEKAKKEFLSPDISLLKRIADLLVSITVDIAHTNERLDSIDDRIETIEIRGR
jgi:hypothetical protein